MLREHVLYSFNYFKLFEVYCELSVSPFSSLYILWGCVLEHIYLRSRFLPCGVILLSLFNVSLCLQWFFYAPEPTLIFYFLYFYHHVQLANMLYTFSFWCSVQRFVSCIQHPAVGFVGISNLYAFLSFSYLFFWLGPPILCWTEVARVSILVLFLILQEKLLAFHHEYVSYGLVLYNLFMLRYVPPILALLIVFITHEYWLSSYAFYAFTEIIIWF